METDGAVGGRRLAAESARDSGWRPALRIAFRFLFVYLILYNFPSPLQFVPWAGAAVGEWWDGLKQDGVVWVAERLFGVEITVFPNGSGDTTYNYFEVLCYAAVALLAAAVWSAADFRRRAYPLLHDILRVYVRYTLGMILIGYGMAKVIKTQFPFPDAYRLTETFGEASPMGLLWAFMGHSVGYNLFAGLGETIAGLLLFYRRTTLLGSLVAVGVMGNVVALNFFYDVPVKLFSSHLLFEAFFLMAPDFGRLINLLVLNRPVAPTARLSAFRRKWLHWSWFGVKTCLLLLLMWTTTIGSLTGYRTYGDGAPPPPLFGLYTVEEFSLGGEARPPLATDGERWREVIVGKVAPWDGLGTFRARTMTGEVAWFRYRLDEAAKTLTLVETTRGPGRVPGQSTWAQGEQKPAEFTLNYAEPEGGILTLEGTVGDKAISTRLKIKPLDEFLLRSRGYHWINEHPFNR